MKRIFGNFLMILLMALQAVGFSSCIYENYDEVLEEQPQPSKDGKILLKLQVNSINTDENQERELIHTIRVVMINDKGIVELNQKEVLDHPASTYYFETLALAGEKKFFFIANEDNINCINSDESNTPLTNILRTFVYGDTGFEETVNSLYFDKSYFENTNNPIPLSSQYTVDVKPGIQEYVFWLVHTATKYTVHFTNNRVEQVHLNDLYISKLAEEMYVMPHVGVTTMEDKPWIDWLREVSDKSHEEDSNEGDSDFNDKYGWLTNYSIPSQKMFDYYLVKNADITIPGLQTVAGEEPQPGKASLGPFYTTEGKNLIPGNTNGYQQYILHMCLTDTKDGKEHIDYRTLPNLSALFRNTHVIIYITLDESWMHIYGQIESWSSSNVTGSATEEQ